MKKKSAYYLFVLCMIGLLTMTTSVFSQETPVEFETTPLTKQKTLIDSFLQTSEAPFEQSPQSENLVNASIIVGGSNLLSSAQANQIAGYLREGEISLTKIFSKTPGDGKTAASFHAAADGKGRTITVLLVQRNGQQYLIGGYNPQSWSSIGNYNVTADAVRTAFIFNLTSNFVQPQKLNAELNGLNGQNQTYNHSAYGPTFGSGHDLGVADFNLQTASASNLSYGTTTNSNNILNIALANAPSIQILGLEVFTISSCTEFQYVGFYRVSDGLSWQVRPPTYTGKEAAAMAFGGSPQDYVISVNPSQDPQTITHTAWVDGFGTTAYMDNPAPEDFKRGTNYNCNGCAFSAFVRDHSGYGRVNYVWRRMACALNSAPSAAADAFSTDEDAPLSVPANGVLGNDTDAENNALTAVLVSAPSNAASFALNADGSFSYMPNPNFNGTDSFTYKANDGQADSAAATVAINVHPVNDAPALSNVPVSATVDELSAYGFTASASDVDLPAQTLVFSLVGAPEGAGIDPSTGQFSWTPSEAQGPGNYLITVRVSDGAENTDASISLAVNEVNSAPLLADVPSAATIDELVAYEFTAAASDADVPAQTLAFVLVGAPDGASINPSTGHFSWTPTEAQGNGATYSFSVRVSDGFASADAPVSVTVNDVNSAPVLDAISDRTVDEQTLLTVTAAAVDSDDPANALAFSLDNAPPGMTIDPSTGALNWTPTEEQGAGDYSVTVRVTDDGSGNLFDTKTFNVHVNEANAAPVLNPVGSRTVDEQVALNFTATAGDSDLPANNLTFSLVGAPEGASITSGGAFSWTPDETQGPGSYTFTVRVTDDGAPNLSGEEVITVTVNEANRPPVLNSINNLSGFWGNELEFTAAASDPDLPANTLTYSLDGAPAGASINPSSGEFSWTPTAAQLGAHTFTVRVNDNENLEDARTVTLTVGKRPAMLAYTGGASGQYSDGQTLSAVLTDNGGGAMQGMPLSGKTIGLALGANNAAVATDAAGTVSTEFLLATTPGSNYTVNASFAGDAQYLPGSDSDAFEVLPEDARVYYTGTLFVNTLCETCGSGTATLSATVKDITAEKPDPAFDASAGDIRNAKVTFVNRDTNTPIPNCSNLPVNLVNSSDPKTGTAVCNWGVNIGSANSMDFTVGIIVNNFYTRNSSSDNTVVTVSKPIGTNFITGGGYLVNSFSNGQYAGANGAKTNFGFNVKYKSGNAPDGNVLVMIQGADGRTYQIKGNVMQTLSVRTVSTSPLVKEAVYTGLANVTDITDSLNPVALGGSGTFQMELTDKGEPGRYDTIGFTVWGDDGSLLFSSHWDGTRTAEQLLGGGNLVIR